MASIVNENGSCSFKTCTIEVKSKNGTTEVSTVIPKGFKADKYLVKWKKTGEAKFHTQCWNKLLKASRTYGRKKKTVPTGENIILSTAERTMIKEANKTAEYHDSLEDVKNEAKRIAALLKNSAHCVAFTGAGISTSAGIGDYRGKTGKWTEQDRDGITISQEDDDLQPSPAKRARFNRSISEFSEADEEEEDGVAYELLRPTYTHEALYKLEQLGFLKHIISQNGDGLHALSGFPLEKLSELHGNVFLEKCEKCWHIYERSYYVMDDHASLYFEEVEDNGSSDIIKPKHAKKCSLCGLNHRTGRKCIQKVNKKVCNGYLMDTIINFRDNLEEHILNKAKDESKECDLFLCLGTTLLVTPACDLVMEMKKPQRYVVCNRQTTGLDQLCSIRDSKTKETLGSRVFGDCDLLMKEVMKNLLDPNELKEWEEGRANRLEEYDSKRD